MGTRTKRGTVISLWLLVPAIAAGFVLGRAGAGNSGSGALAQTDASCARPTATRAAELIELERLRTRVAQTPPAVICTPAATATPTPTPTPVPPAAMNVPLPYKGDWTVMVTSVVKTATVSGYNQSATAKGVYIQVNLLITNNARDRRTFPFRELVLVDAQGRVFEPALKESIMVGGNWSLFFPTSNPTASAIVFDVPTDAGDTFILESRKDPAFRVWLDVQLRG